MIRSLETRLVELPLPVLGLIAVAHSQYDAEAECRQWGGYTVLGTGLTTGLDLWTVTQDVVRVDGRPVSCVRLTKRERHHSADKGEPKDWFFPFESLRKGIVAELPMATEAA